MVGLFLNTKICVTIMDGFIGKSGKKMGISEMYPRTTLFGVLMCSIIREDEGK